MLLLLKVNTISIAHETSYTFPVESLVLWTSKNVIKCCPIKFILSMYKIKMSTQIITFFNAQGNSVYIAATPQQECKLVFASRQRRDRLAPASFLTCFTKHGAVMSLLRNEAKTTLHSLIRLLKSGIGTWAGHVVALQRSKGCFALLKSTPQVGHRSMGRECRCSATKQRLLCTPDSGRASEALGESLNFPAIVPHSPAAD